MGTKLSQIAPAGSPPALTDQIVGVTGGTTDNLFSLSQIVSSVGGRSALAGNTTYHVSQSGSDSTGDGSVGNPWKTGQHACNFISASIDLAGFNVTVQFSDSVTAYAGFIAGEFFSSAPSVTGVISANGNIFVPFVTFAGNAADHTKVTIGPGTLSTSVCIGVNPSDSAVASIKNVTIDCQNTAVEMISVNGPTEFYVGDGSGGTIRFKGGTNPGFNPYGPFCTTGAFVGVNDNLIFQGTFSEILLATQEGQMDVAAAISASGTVTATYFAGTEDVDAPSGRAVGGTLFFDTTTTITGTFTCAQYLITTNGVLSTFWYGSALPGTAGTLLPGGQYNYKDSHGNLRVLRATTDTVAQDVSGAPDNTRLTSAAFNFFKDTSQPATLGIRGFYNDSGTVVPLTRQILTADTTFYVSTTGSDSNPGTLASPWATPQHAMDYLAGNTDLAGFNVIIQHADGTYASPQINGFPVGQGALSRNFGFVNFLGNTGAITNVIWTDTGSNTAGFSILDTECVCNISVEAIQFSPSLNCFACVTGDANNAYVWLRHITFVGNGTHNYGLVSFNSLSTFFLDRITVTGATWGNFVASAVNGPFCQFIFIGAATINGTPNWTTAFVNMADVSQVGVAQTASFTGAATGVRYLVAANGVIDTAGGGANFFPGNAAGSTATGGQYL